LSNLFCWLKAHESLAVWLEGIALVAIFFWDRLDNRSAHKETLKQLAIMQSQADAAKDSAEAAQANAEAAKLSAQAVLNSERAWVEIKIGSRDQPDDEDELPSVRYGLFECSVQIENHGRTIAHVESVRIGADTVNEPLPQEPSNFTLRNLHSVLGSGQKETVGGFDAEAFLESESILDRTKRGVLRITVKYRDVVETSMLRETTAVYVFQGSLEDEPEKVSSLSVYT
jgi:hypothetical protein